jgi:hypothetical protein
MLRIKLILSLAILGAPLTATSQDTTLAGWTFSQFLGEGLPAVDGGTGDPTSFIAATFRGAFDPVINDVDGAVTVQNGAPGYTDDAFGSWSFDNFNITNAIDVRADTFGALNTINSITLDDKRMHLTDSAGMMLTFNVTATLWSVKVNGTEGYSNASTSDFTYAARGNGGNATLEWLFNGEVFSTTEIQAGSFGVYEAELPAAFYGNGLIEGRLVAGSVSFDNVQVNGQLGTPPSFTTQPAGLVRLVGESATFSVVVAGAVSPTYQWFKGASQIQGATSAAYTLNSLSLSDAGEYRVSVRSANGTTADSEFANLEVRQAPAISQDPATQSANPAQTVTFTVVASGSPSPTYRWQRDGVDLTDAGNISGSSTATLTLVDVSAADEGDYGVVVSNVVSSLSSGTARFTVTNLAVAPEVSTAPADTTAVRGGTVELIVVASGAPAPTYQWFFGDLRLTDGAGISGTNSGILTLSDISAASAGRYRVVVTNSAGTVEREALLTVLVPPMIVSGPGPESRSVLAGSNVSFTVEASGDPEPTFQWLRNGSAIEGQTSATLTLTAVTEANDGQYSLRATNAAGSVTSAISALTVGRSALITSQPEGALIAVGGSVTLRVIASGRPAPSYQWFLNGDPIDGADQSTLSISSATASSAGSYTVRVSNQFATETSQAAVVRVAQTVSMQNARQVQSFVPGSTLSIGLPDVEVSSSLRYVWYRNGKVIPGANGASLFIESASFADSGEYLLRVFGAGNRLLGSRLISTLQISVAGSYEALVRDLVDGVPVGGVALNVAAKGAFTGTFRHEDGASYALKGSFSFPTAPDQGLTSVTVRRGSLEPIVLDLDLNSVSRELTVGRRLGLESAVSANGVGLSRLSTKTAAWAGSYALALSTSEESPLFTLAVSINPRASLQLRGVLPDGVRVTGSYSSDFEAGYVVVLRPYAKVAGLLAGGLRLESSPSGYFADEDSSGVWSWTRAASGTRPAVDEVLEPALAP